MNKEFIPYEQALALKELGFDNVSCLGVYYGNYTEDERSQEWAEPEGFVLSGRETQYYAQKGFENGILAPLYQQAFKWFRDEHKLCYKINTPFDGENEWFGAVSHYNKYQNEWRVIEDSGFIGESYEESQLECLKKLIKLIK